MFIISSDDFNQAYKRLLYVKQYTTQRKNYSIQISKEQNELKQEINKLELIKKSLRKTLFKRKNFMKTNMKTLTKFLIKKLRKNN